MLSFVDGALSAIGCAEARVKGEVASAERSRSSTGSMTMVAVVAVMIDEVDL